MGWYIAAGIAGLLVAAAVVMMVFFKLTAGRRDGWRKPEEQLCGAGPRRALFLYQPSNGGHNAAQAQALADYLRGEGAEAHSCETVQQGMEKALSMAGPEDVVCVCGSLYMIGEARHVLGLC